MDNRLSRAAFGVCEMGFGGSDDVVVGWLKVIAGTPDVKSARDGGAKGKVEL